MAINGVGSWIREQEGEDMEWARILAYITGTVDQELLLRNEYLAAENGILKAQLKGCLRLSDAERAKLGEIGHRLGRKSLSEVATVLTPRGLVTYYVLFFIQGSPSTQMSSGCSKWLGTRPWRDAAPFESIAISCMIATRSTPSPSERSSSQVRSRRFPCLHEART